MTEEEKKEYLAYHSYNDVLENFHQRLSEYEINLLEKNRNSVLIAGGMIGFDKGISSFLNQWYGLDKRLFLLSEVTAENRRYTKERIVMPYICTPHLFAKEIVITGMEIPLVNKLKHKCDEVTYLRHARENYEARYRGQLGKGYAYNYVWNAYEYLKEVISILQPSQVIMWNEFYAFHTILKGICVDKKIQLAYMEFGCIPGTFCIESRGQQGESIPAINPRHFEEKSISAHEIERTKEVLNYLKQSKANRNIQPNSLFDTSTLKYYDENRKTIVFYGHNEFESGIFPYTYKSKKYHSPIFRSSNDAVKFLADFAYKNNLNIIYKMHPIMVSLGFADDLEIQGVDIVNDVDINELIDFADVNVTILSQVAYISSIREKATLMLGYTQISGKGCVYEAYSKYKVKKTLLKALNSGPTLIQKNKFIQHCTRLLKYYLYDDMTHEEIKFGKRML